MISKFISSVWEFDNGDKQGIHDMMRWYGKLPQKLPRKLIEMYSERGDTIMANFAGSGTVVAEANLADRNAIGSDVHPLSILTNAVKFNSYLPVRMDGFLAEVEKAKFNKPPVYFENQYKWFSINALTDIGGILARINGLKSAKQRDFYTLALAQIIRNASRIDSRCINHIVVDRSKTEIDVRAAFVESAYDLKNKIAEYKKSATNSSIRVSRMDARELELGSEEVDLMISHPPYANAVLYYNIYSLISNILGYNYYEIRRHDMSAGSFDSYLANMRKVLGESYRVVKHGGFNALIIGDIRKNGDILTAFPHMVKAGKDAGFRLRDIFIWKLKQKAGMGVARRGHHIDHNYIMIFQKT